VTLITMSHDAELLLRQLRQRLAYIRKRIASQQRRENSVNQVTVTAATAALIELSNERDWLQSMINQIKQGELTNGA
jgi:hypothetical protein